MDYTWATKSPDFFRPGTGSIADATAQEPVQVAEPTIQKFSSGGMAEAPGQVQG